MIKESELARYIKNYEQYHADNSLYTDPKTEILLPYGNKYVSSVNEGNNLIKSYLRAGKPFMLGRFGETELRVVMFGLMNQFPIYNPLRKRRILQRQCANWCEGAGFFPKNVNLIPKFTDIYIDACKELDILAVWYNWYEDYISDYYASNAKVCRFQSLNSFFEYPSDNNWTEELKGKKVLVISPFADTIEKQYMHRDKIYQNAHILPEFELQTIKAVESPITTGRKNGYNNWFSALEGMYEKTLEKDYDVALLGCGAYGFPLAAKIKESGHMAIQLCGITQILFGIKGHRWEKYYSEQLKNVENEYWTRPSEIEIPKNKNEVENGCYW